MLKRLRDSGAQVTDLRRKWGLKSELYRGKNTIFMPFSYSESKAPLILCADKLSPFFIIGAIIPDTPKTLMSDVLSKRT